MAAPLRAAILVVSTTAARDASTDASTEVLHNVLKDQGEGKWEVTRNEIVSDESVAIQRQLMAWADGPDAVNLIITTGGTGFAVSDGTPEVRWVSIGLCYWSDLTSIILGRISVAAQASPGLGSWHACNLTVRDAM